MDYFDDVYDEFSNKYKKNKNRKDLMDIFFYL
jgi:hypothetical protein